MMIYCPTCGKKVDDNYQVPETEPFTATNPMLGLQVWGPYSSEKTILCQGRTWVHFKFEADGNERLVQLGVPLTEPFGPDGYIDEAEDNILMGCPKCNASWGFDEMRFQQCDVCGYGSGPDDDDEDDFWNHGPDDLPF